ncbi:MAG TPA: O-antigen ligase family protein [Bacteroidales bacterium]|nr:O-antigen ligase family protein [Bacteroidales bacterium]
MMKVKTNIAEWILILLAFLMPVWAKLVPIVIAVLFLLWLVEGGFKNKFHNLIRNKTGLVFILFYLLYVAGMIYTNDIERGRFDLEVKLSLFLFPVLFFSGSKSISETRISYILKSFVSGCLVITVFLLGRAFYFYFQNHEFVRLTYTGLSFFMSPSYLAMYLNFSVMIIFFSFFDGIKSKIILFLHAFLMLFFAGFIVLLSSKSGIITMAFSIIFIFIYLVIRKKYFFLSVLTLILMVSVFLVLKFATVTTERMMTAIDTFMNYQTVPNTAEESTSERILVWRASAEIIKNNPLLGVGTGDVKEELLHEYQNEHISYAIEKSINAHNQYLQTAVAIGLIGLLVLLFSLFVPMFRAVAHHHWIYFVFLFLIVMNLLFESMLERQAGVVFYAFFNALLWSRLSKNVI